MANKLTDESFKRDGHDRSDIDEKDRELEELIAVD